MILSPQAILYDYAMRHTGIPYIWGGDDPIKGFDCSGFVIELLQSVDVFPHGQDTTAHGLYEMFEKFEVGHPEFGALAFFGSPERMTHVAFVLNRYQMIEAGGGGSKTRDRTKAAKHNAYVRVRPIDIRSDLMAFLMPEYPW